MKILFPEFKTKTVTFSYDDGIYGTDAILIELFNKYNIKGTFNIIGIIVLGILWALGLHLPITGFSGAALFFFSFGTFRN